MEEWKGRGIDMNREGKRRSRITDCTDCTDCMDCRLYGLSGRVEDWKEVDGI